MAKLTITEIERAQPGGTRYTLFDDEVRGFGIRVFPSGQKSYILEYRPGAGGRGVAKKRITLGVFGSDLTPDAARKQARAMLADIRRGDDPAASRKRAREMPTFREFGEDYLERAEAAGLKPRTVVNYGILLRKYAFPALGSLKLDAVTATDVRRLHREMAKTQPANANRMVATVGAVYRCATDDESLAITANPARGIKKPAERKRERFLTSDELQRLGDTLRTAETIGLPWASEADPTKRSKHRPVKEENRRTVFTADETAAIRLLLLTGCRLREILHARWTDIDMQRGILNLADSKTGARPVILSAPALAVLSRHPKTSAYVIAGSDPRKPRADLKRPWAAVTAHADLARLRLHDLRHTFASVGAGGGMGLPVIGKLLGHTNAATTARYAHLADTQAKRATDMIAGGIAAALGEQRAA
jgi:integrase